MRTLLAFAFALTLPSLAAAHDFRAGDLVIDHPAMPQPVRAGGTAAGYFSITNSGSAADALVGIESGFGARTELHTTEADAAGVLRMVHVPRLEIAAGESVALEPGGFHVMFMGIDRRPELGERIPAVLVFETAGRVEVEFAVEAPSAGGHNH